MQYKKLGNTGLDVSPICIGCMGFGEPSRAYPSWSLDEEVSRSLIRHSIEAGINFFDTANMYSNGGSEEIVGRALKEFTNRDSVVIATKVAAATHNGPNAIGLVNYASELHGVQIGLLNWAGNNETLKLFPILNAHFE